METEIKRTSTKDIITYLTEKFPECFSIKGPVKPLKIGIFQDLAEKLSEDDTVSKTRLRQALRHYTSSWRYLKAVKVGVFRVDIDGKEVAEIDEEQANYASKTLKESQEKFGNKKNVDKKSAKPTNDTARPKTDKPQSDAKSAKFKSVKTKRPVAKKEAAPLKPVESATIKVGSQVKVQLGNSPMNASITEISGQDISVQLDSGMIIKTKLENIYS
ncbi:RNA chaperone ProQ [Colwellia sp. D2M02]|uniref:RNA chaperone ProQ n=1 Tax=Colwellia asteriadis TaxID=517723 RepID=A0ABN1L8T3_9GAMM|nr:RNA chaperone ProQ [Colwellia sp. D2M02]MBU2894116.1 RNA chaperone ProQ [Colwellia sp. D2M02]